MAQITKNVSFSMILLFFSEWYYIITPRNAQVCHLLLTDGLDDFGHEQN